MTTQVKICGIRDPATAEAAAAAGAAYVGLNFYPPSPRAITPRQAAHIKASLPETVQAVGLFVDPDDALLDAVLGVADLDIIQLHGAETPERVAEISQNYGLPVAKAVPIAGPGDLDTARAYEEVAAMLLFDAKPPRGAMRPGGNGLTFEWHLLAGRLWKKPWMLSGGLTVQNVGEAIRLTGARIVDVSSGVEDATGIKNIEKIEAFIRAAQKV
jgi:phosphoribosylanthranilate isomerase